MHRIPPLAAVRVFEAASRHENFSRAAEELAMTQAAVSYQMKLLEERLGGPLFVRRGRGMALTELGRRIAPRVSGAFAELDKAFGMARAENDAVLSITAPQTFATNWLAGRLGEFQINRPDLAVRLNASDEMVDLASSEFDAAIRAVPHPGPGMVGHFLMRMPVTPFASPDFLKRHPLESAADLLAVPRLSPDDDWWTLWFDSLADLDASSRLRTGIRFELQALDGSAAMAGHGVAILSPPMFQPAIAAGLLVQPFAHIATHHNGFWLVYPEHKRNLAKVRALRDWLLHAVKRAAGDDPYGILQPLPGA
jgi:LysR family transcriptional regulator, glycine cleavage system transcriptional activator